MKISILGRDYEICESTPEKDSILKDADGYCDPSVGLCVIDSHDTKRPDDINDIKRYKRKVTRHELIHAFLAESGLREECEWACEEMVDWIACQFPKMAKAFSEAECAD